MLKQGGFAEYVCVREGELAPKPKNLSFEQAAAVPMAAVTALLGLRDQGRIQPGQKVLVNGASGGVGTFAVQIAKAFGAEVTGVCSTRNVDLVRSIGADEVIDYTTEDFTRNGQRYDLCWTSPAAARVGMPAGADAQGDLRPRRRAGRPMAAARRSRVRRRSRLSPFVSQEWSWRTWSDATENKQNLMTLTELIEDGKITPVIGAYPFEEIPAAVRYQEEGHAPGKVVITV